MKLYLTARWARREELRGYRDQLRALVHAVPCSWLDSTLQLDDAAPAVPALDSHSVSFAEAAAVTRASILRAKVAETIFTEITDCDGLIAFTDLENNARGAAVGEYAGALFQGKKVWLVGVRSNVLHYFKDVPCFASWSEFLPVLAALGDVEKILGEQKPNEESKPPGKGKGKK